MIISLLLGAIIGIILAIPPGPVAVTAIKMGLNKGPREGLLVGLGASIVDFFFCTIAGFATSAALLLIESFAFHHPLATLSLQFLIVAGILIYGFVHLNPKKPFVNGDSVEKVQKSGLLHFLTSKGSFFIGIAISLANMANPTFIPSLTYITLHVQKYGIIENTTLGNFAFAFGFGVGNFLWIYFVTRSLIYFKPKMSDNFLTKIQRFAGFTLIGFGTFLGWKIFELTKWSEIVRFVFAF